PGPRPGASAPRPAAARGAEAPGRGPGRETQARAPGHPPGPRHDATAPGRADLDLRYGPAREAVPPRRPARRDGPALPGFEGGRRTGPLDRDVRLSRSVPSAARRLDDQSVTRARLAAVDRAERDDL